MAYGTDDQYQGAAIRLITCFEADFELPGLTRGCPDFVFTVLTYAAVSLLKATQHQFSHLEPNRSTIFHLARKAADMLARAAMAPDHLPASQSVFLSRLIEVKTHEPMRETVTFEPEPIDFEAFGNSINEDQTKTLWPPMPGTDFEGSIMPTISALTDGNQPTDLSSWVAQNQVYPVPGAALGLGAGSFLQDQNLLFNQDSFW